MKLVCGLPGGALALTLLLGFAPCARAEGPQTEEAAEDELAADVAMQALLDEAREEMSAVREDVVSASRQSEHRLRAPATMTVIDRRALQTSGAMHIPDVLRRVPGVQLFRSAPGRYEVALRGAGGFQGNNALVLLDSVPVNSIADNSVDWSLLPVALHDIERIEIVRGPVSTIYGANAYTGVINIVSRAASAESVRTSLAAHSGVDAETAWAGGLSASVSGTRGRSSARASASLQRDGVWAEMDPNALTAREAQTPMRAASASLVFQHQISDLTRAVARAGVAGSKRSSLDHLVLDAKPQRNRFGYASVVLERSETGGPLPRLAVWARSRWNDIRARRATDTFTYGGLEALTGAAGVDLSWRFLSAAQLDMGAEGRLAWLDAPYIHPAETAITRPGYGGYLGVSGEPLDHVSLSAAARADASAFTGDLELSYRASAVYFRDTWSMRATLASAFRDPTHVEVGGRFVDPVQEVILLEGRGDLASPRVHSAELSALMDLGSLTLAPSVYVAVMQDLMLKNFDSVVRKTFGNDANNRSVLGVELEGDVTLLSWVTAQLSASWLNWLDKETDPGITLGAPGLNSSITAWAGLLTSWLEGEADVSLGVGYQSARDYNARIGVPAELWELEVPAHVYAEARGNLRLTRRYPTWAWLKAQVGLPRVVEAPFPTGAMFGSSIFVGLEYRGE